MKIINGFKTYATECCECGHKFYAGKSLFHEMGQNDFGGGTCPKCDTFLNLRFDPEKEIMISKKHSDWVEERKKESEESEVDEF